MDKESPRSSGDCLHKNYSFEFLELKGGDDE